MRLRLFLAGLFLLNCRPDGSGAELTAKSPSFNFTVKTDSRGAGLVERSEQFNLAFSTVNGTCGGSPCPNKASLSLTFPPQLIWAGPWSGTAASLRLINETTMKTVAAVDFSNPGNSLVIDFGPPTYSPSGESTMFNDGTVTGSATINGETVAFTGSARSESACSTSGSDYYVNCGNV